VFSCIYMRVCVCIRFVLNAFVSAEINIIPRAVARHLGPSCPPPLLFLYIYISANGLTRTERALTRVNCAYLYVRFDSCLPFYTTRYAHEINILYMWQDVYIVRRTIRVSEMFVRNNSILVVFGLCYKEINVFIRHHSSGIYYIKK